jgi:hypothetical protein
MAVPARQRTILLAARALYATDDNNDMIDGLLMQDMN